MEGVPWKLRTSFKCVGLIGSPLLQEVVGGGISLHVKVNVPQILPHGKRGGRQKYKLNTSSLVSEHFNSAILALVTKSSNNFIFRFEQTSSFLFNVRRTIFWDGKVLWCFPSTQLHCCFALSLTKSVISKCCNHIDCKKCFHCNSMNQLLRLFMYLDCLYVFLNSWLPLCGP